MKVHTASELGLHPLEAMGGTWFKFNCPHCHAGIEFDSTQENDWVECPGCEDTITFRIGGTHPWAPPMHPVPEVCPGEPCPANACPDKGVKHDQGKVRFDLVPPEAVVAIANVLSHGVEKYGERNWEKGIDHGRLLGAIFGHIIDYMLGNKLDSGEGGSSLPHLWHALCDLSMLVSLIEREGCSFGDVEVKEESCRTLRGRRG